MLSRGSVTSIRCAGSDVHLPEISLITTDAKDNGGIQRTSMLPMRPMRVCFDLSGWTPTLAFECSNGTWILQSHAISVGC